VNEQRLSFTGRVWCFGPNISTDLIQPGDVALAATSGGGAEARKRLALACMRANRPGWAEQVQPGDLLFAGSNFGCGSSRPAQRVLRTLGIAAVVAESVSRIFYRNCINTGFPVLICPGVSTAFEELDTAEVDLERGTVRSLTTGVTLSGEAAVPGSPPAEILRAGGLEAYLRAELLAMKES